MKILVFSCIITFSFSADALPKSILAVVKVPVADACGFRIGSCSSAIGEYYQTLPYSPDSGPYGCLRIHQLLFNELVTITKEYPGGEVGVETTGWFFLDGFHRKRHDFWMLKKDLMIVNSLPKEFRRYIPSAIDHKKAVDDYSKNILVLAEPWLEEKTNQLYSTGTRFVREIEKDTETDYSVIFIEGKKKVPLSALIQKEKALVYNESSFERGRRTFLSLIRGWAHPKKGFIPYVYGGSSFTETLQDSAFNKVTGMRCNAKATYWERPAMKAPHSGFDCSNMILRAAQMSFMPYYFKNTLALMTYMRPLKLGEKLEEGDLVWYSGHVMVVSNVAQNLLIEAVGYEVTGYGAVHEIPVNRVFHGIKNFEQLVHAHLTHQFTHRLNNKGAQALSVYRLKIFKLRSVFDGKIPSIER